MKRMDDADLRQKLAALPREEAPPADLESRVLARLRERDAFLAPRSASPRALRFRSALAATLLVGILAGGAAGWFGKEILAPGGPTAEDLPAGRFLLLLSEPEPLQTSKALPELVAEYRGWAQELAQRGRLVSAERLLDGARRLGSDAPAPVAGDPLTGFFVIRAEGWEEALAIASSCPHLGYGGAVTVREASTRSG